MNDERPDNVLPFEAKNPRTESPTGCDCIVCQLTAQFVVSVVNSRRLDRALRRAGLLVLKRHGNVPRRHGFRWHLGFRKWRKARARILRRARLLGWT